MSTLCKWPGCKASAWYKGYCALGHAKKKFPTDPTVIEAERKRTAGIKDGHGKRSSRTKQQVEAEKVQREIEKENKEKIAADKLFHDIVQDKDFNLKEVVSECEELEGNLESLMQEFYIAWQMAHVGTRKPQTLKDVAVILRVKQIELRRWGENSSFTEKRERARINRNKLIAIHTDKSVAVDVLQGKKEATKKFYEISQLKPPPSNADDYSKGISEEFQKDIDEAAGIEDTKSGTLRQTDDEKRESKALDNIIPEFKSPSIKTEEVE